ncbi:hypothetical protein NIES37_34020 [Tolypothrix tenuis PCC 7101]|uniref:Bacteriocin-type signal sequence n=1 Tax=Tolypothrix tenuis PCC 7101 TaxID=231146 RepID=A0A1Z4N152_9CYAN|nr:bacteriocin [Aulosira sp. FACHB-113]BAY99420.1 hypothetical protein NIES37_34020 [Tolypothrix tenuis PCC 7101]BAZ76659.1 hypothetical protein NIES50_52580 [Aulosira laxa NIES-50]
MSNEQDINNAPIELTDEELDQVSGGIDIFISGATFEQRNVFSARRGSRRRGGNSIYQSSSISSSAFQLIGLGFGSVGDAMSFLQGFSKLFGRR